uniref:Uncharacterized protein n=1 Tax=Anopheles funestus TaxID=62324 RepID=A0A4Y0BDW0_ANOFN
MGSESNNTPQPNVSTEFLQLDREFILSLFEDRESEYMDLQAEVSRLTEQVAKLVKELDKSKSVQAEIQRELDLWRQGTKEIQTVEDRPKCTEPGLPTPQQLQESESAEGPVVQTTSRRQRRQQQYQKQQQQKVQPQQQQTASITSEA